MYSYARENLALVNIYIKQPVVTKILRDQRIPVIWFVANCGGILGLCMGFSIVTVFEVLHCLTNVTFQSLANWYQNVRINFWDINIFTLYKKSKTIKEPAKRYMRIFQESSFFNHAANGVSNEGKKVRAKVPPFHDFFKTSKISTKIPGPTF